MKKLLVLVAALSLPACTDPYGRTDPAGTALLGAAAGAAVGYGVGQATAPRDRYRYADSGYYYGRPYAPRQYYYGQPYQPQPYYGGAFGRPYAYRW
ncbi:MAG TPA: hypothetical protein VD970_16175 [Acetobacteraceae bacterium]|nr:hypothetical protein [Acetobacteraceae bacterium]